jgi:hypothetical protein
MKILRALIGALLIAAAPVSVLVPVAVTTGCVALKGDPVIIRAEQSIQMGFATCDAFVRFEYKNNKNGELGADVRKAAERIRRYAPGWIESANAILRAYKHNKTDENKANLITALAVIETAMVEANKHLAGNNQ